jgi:hypothetical protein
VGTDKRACHSDHHDQLGMKTLITAANTEIRMRRSHVS